MSAQAVRAELRLAVEGTDSLALVVELDWAEPLPPEIRERLERGIPATLALEVELWRERSGWFDRSAATGARIIHVTRDPWDGSFVAWDADMNERQASLEALSRVLSHLRVALPTAPGWIEEAARWHVHGAAMVLPLTAEDLLEVESWLAGEGAREGQGVFGVPRMVLAAMRDLSGLRARRESGRSESFELGWDGAGVSIVVADSLGGGH